MRASVQEIVLRPIALVPPRRAGLVAGIAGIWPDPDEGIVAGSQLGPDGRVRFLVLSPQSSGIMYQVHSRGTRPAG